MTLVTILGCGDENAETPTPGASATSMILESQPVPPAQSADSNTNVPITDTRRPAGTDPDPSMVPDNETPVLPSENAQREEIEHCRFDGVSGIKIVADVIWPESLALEGGQDTFEIWFRAHMTDEDTHLIASGQVCAVDVPDFHTKPLAGGDTHGTVIPSEA